MAYWITTKTVPTASHYYDFEKAFEVTAGALMQMKICADTRYQLYINEHLASEGPCQGPIDLRYYETVDLSSFLRDGRNHIRVRVFHAVGDTMISAGREARPALLVDGSIVCGKKTQAFGTDRTWSCQRIDGIKLHQQGFISLPPMEEVIPSLPPSTQEIVEAYAPNWRRQGFNDYGLNDLYVLAERTIPQMKTQSPKEFSIVRQGDGWIELDAGIYTTAKIDLSFIAKKNSVLRILYAECYGKKSELHNHYPDKGLRDDASSEDQILVGKFDLVEALGETQRFSPFWYRTFRYVRIEFDPQAKFELISITHSPYFYPLGEEGSFSCSDPRLTQMWEISRNTVLCCMHEMYVDCPYYEQQQYDMDSALEALFTYRLSSDARMPLKSLIDLSHSQLSDGMLQANFPSTHVQVIPDFTLFWILMARDYKRYTGDAKSLRPLLGTIDKALEAFEALKNENGLISPTRYWHFVDWVPAWDRGVPTGGDEEPLTVTALMYAAALSAAADIFRSLDRTARADEYEERARSVCDAVNRLCYDHDVELYRDTPTRHAFSQHTTLWAILSGAVTEEDAGALLDRTFLSQNRVEVCTFSMNHYLFRALEASNRYTEYAPRLFEGWKKMLDLHCTTWCENPDDPRSECHGWSSAPIYEFSERVLGVLPTSDGYRTVRISPDTVTHNLSWANGSVPTPFGEILIRWEKTDRLFTLDVTLPEGICADIYLPDKTVRTQQQRHATYRVEQ